MFELAMAKEADGIDVVHLEVGRPSFDTPRHIKEAAKDALDSGYVHYDDLRGIEPLRAALAEKSRVFNGLPPTENDVLVTVGLSQGAFATFMALIDPGDEVIVLAPFYPQHPPRIALAGGVAVPVPLDKAAGWRLDCDRIRDALTPRTKAICLVNPANPVGRVFSEEELLGVADLAVEYDLLVVSDEVYEYITFDDARHLSIGALPGMWDRTVTLSAFTKAYAMDGWRIGYVVAPPRLLDPIRRVATSETTHPTVFAQYGALAAVTQDQQCVRDMVKEDQRCRDMLLAAFSESGAGGVTTPEGSIYAFPDVSRYGISSSVLAEMLLDETHVAVESGTFYGSAGEGHLRICFGSQPVEVFGEAVGRVVGWLDGIDP